MSKGHARSAETSIDYGDAGCLFPVDELDATVDQYRDAQLALDGVDGSDVIFIGPTNLASSYLLTQHPLTAIPIESLPAAVQTQIADKLDIPLATFDLIQIGKWSRDFPDHSLTEFVDT